MRCDYGLTPFALAVVLENAHMGVLELLAVNNRDIGGYTPLTLAATSVNFDVVKFLIARDDVELDSKDNIGRTLLS